jgi:hypothetical protein
MEMFIWIFSDGPHAWKDGSDAKPQFVSSKFIDKQKLEVFKVSEMNVKKNWVDETEL